MLLVVSGSFLVMLPGEHLIFTVCSYSHNTNIKQKAMLLLTIVSVLFLIFAFISAAIIIQSLRLHSQSMKVMNVVWPLTALWSGLLGLWAYFSFGKSAGSSMDISMDKDMDMSGMNMRMDDKPFWQKIALSTFHCGAGCTLADIIGESVGSKLLFSLGLYNIVWQWTLDYILALIIGVWFQYAAIRPMMKSATRSSVFLRALKVDFLSLTSWQAGMYILSYLLIIVAMPYSLPHDTFLFWFIMQLAMCAGFLCSYPMNWFLVKNGIKPAM